MRVVRCRVSSHPRGLTAVCLDRRRDTTYWDSYCTLPLKPNQDFVSYIVLRTVLTTNGFFTAVSHVDHASATRDANSTYPFRVCLVQTIS